MSEESAILDKPILKKKKNTPGPAYTKAEDQLILDTVMQYPDNMAHAFSIVAAKLKNRKVTSIGSRYHYIVRKDKSKGKIVTGSAAGFTGKKTNKRINGHFHRKEPLQPLIVVLKQILDLDPGQRKKISEFLRTIE